MRETAVPLDRLPSDGEFQEIVGNVGLTEAPIYDAERNSILFSDVTGGSIWECAWSGEVREVPVRRRGIGGMALNDDGRLIVSGRDVSAASMNGDTEQICSVDDLQEGYIGFNDLCADKHGRVYVGALTFSPLKEERSDKPGGIYKLASGASPEPVFEGLTLPNGMAFDWSRSRLYISDSGAGCVVVLEYLEDSGNLKRQGVIDYKGPGRPDGLAMAADGTLFVARAESGTIDLVSPTGVREDSLAVSNLAVTSLCFAGRERDVLVATGGELDAEWGTGGRVWAARVPYVGATVGTASF